MKKIAFVILLSVFIGCSERHRVLYAIDGDTIVMDNKEHIRIKDIDAPELSQPFGEKAKEFTNAHLKGKEVIVHYSLAKSYKRSIGEIDINGANFADIIVSEGLAHVSTKYCSNSQLIEEYHEARKQHKGLFASNYEMPYIWRKNHKH